MNKFIRHEMTEDTYKTRSNIDEKKDKRAHKRKIIFSHQDDAVTVVRRPTADAIAIH